ncbi:MAG: hypothetical protein QXS25_01195 [Candidatus Nitrosocaldus sp.]
MKSILDKAKGWKVLHIGPSMDKGKKVGGALDIILDEAVWVEGEFKTLKGIDRVSTWSKSLHISVDLSKEEVVSIEVGSTIPTQEMPPEGDKYSKAKEVAKSRALQEENLKDKNLNVLFVRADIIEEYPDGIAFFLIRSEHGDEMVVAVDMRSMQVVEKYTAKVVG